MPRESEIENSGSGDVGAGDRGSGDRGRADGADQSQRIAAITLDDSLNARRSPEIEHERRIAIYDLLEQNSFSPQNCEPGPYSVSLGVQDNRLVLDIGRAEDGQTLRSIHLSLSPFRQIIRDYFLICGSYYEAIKSAPPSRIEAIDMGRRGIHDEGSRILQSRLKGKVSVDHNTARRLFTLLCVLHIRG
jgi:uncharacterized protein (UPF0262 family)